MSAATDLLVDALGRVQETVHDVLEGIDPGHLMHRLDPAANTIAWLVWHLSRIEDDHIAGVADSDQLWHSDGWFDRFALPVGRADLGFGHTAEQVATVDVGSELLLGYHDAVHGRATDYVRSLHDKDFARIVDRRWDPPVTLGVRLVSVVNDCTQHVGQAAFVRGIVERTRA